MRILVAMDSFKGSATAEEAVQWFCEGLAKVGDIEADPCPLADGGEGTGAIVEKMLGGRRIFTTVVDSYGRPREGWWILWDRTAVIESAIGSGYLPAADRPGDIWQTTSRGTGLLVREAIDSCKADRFMVALGGTGTIDGGMGFLEALGVKFYDSSGRLLAGSAANLRRVCRVSWPDNLPEIVGLYDTFVALLGPQGAVQLYGPQKGVTPSQVEPLENALRHFAHVLEESLQVGLVNREGSGAAGGLGMAIYSIGGTLVSGAQQVANWVSLSDRIGCADWVVTGEGRLDDQSLLGKVVGTVLDSAKKWRRPVIAVAGSIPQDLTVFYQAGLKSVFSLAPGPILLEEAVSRTPELMKQMGEGLGRLLVSQRGCLR
jgi:glycerate kinase